MVPDSTSFQRDGGYVKTQHETVTQKGPGQFGGSSGSVKLNRGAVITPDTSSTWMATGNAAWDIFDWGSDSSNAYLNNLGTFTVTGGDTGSVRSGIPWEDGGTLNLQHVHRTVKGGNAITSGYSYYHMGLGPPRSTPPAARPTAPAST